DPLGEREARGDSVDRDPEGAQLVRELSREGNDAALGRGIGAAAGGADAASRDGRDVDDLAGPLSLHDRGYGVTEEEGRVQVESDQALPLGQRQLVDGGRGAGDDGAATDGVDEDVDTAVGASHAVDRSEEHTSELQSRSDLVCRLLLEK